MNAGYAAGVFTDAGGRLYGMQQYATSPYGLPTVLSSQSSTARIPRPGLAPRTGRPGPTGD